MSLFMDVTTFFGEEDASERERKALIDWHQGSLILLPSAFCTQYCGRPDYPGSRLPLFEELLLEAANRQPPSPNNEYVTTNILTERDLVFLDMLSDVRRATVTVLYNGSHQFYNRNKQLLSKLVTRKYMHVREFK